MLRGQMAKLEANQSDYSVQNVREDGAARRLELPTGCRGWVCVLSAGGLTATRKQKTPGLCEEISGACAEISRFRRASNLERPTI